MGEYRSRAYSGGAGSIPAGRFCSRHGEPAADAAGEKLLSVYRRKIAAVIPAREYVDGQQVFKQLF